MMWLRALAALAATMVLAQGVAAQTKVILGHTGVAEYLAAYVAAEEGMFAKRGLDVTLQNLAGGALVAGLQSGSLQIATLPTTTLVLAADGGLDLVAVAGCTVFAKTDTNTGLLAGANSGVTTPKDLVGKKIAVPSIGGFLYVMSRRWLADHGVDPRQVTFVEVNFQQIGDVLKSGTVPAAVSAAPFMARSVQNGDGRVLAYFPADLPENTTGVVFGATREWAVRNPKAISSFREAIAEGIAFAEKNPQAAREHLRKYTRLSPEIIASIPMPRMMAEVTDAQIRFWVDSMKEQGLIKNVSDASRLVLKP